MELISAVRIAEKVTKQRNLLLLLTIMLSITSMSLAIKILTQEERIVMVPGLASSISISSNKVSASYLEQMSFVFLSCLLDLTANDITHKRDLILKYTSHSDEKFSKRINEYFAEAMKKYQKFDLATFYTAKEMIVDEKKQEVIVHGLLTSRYGREGFDAIKQSYKLSYELVGGILRLKEFGAIKDEQK
jgi:type IV conjugative transfer system protein TraE